MFQPPWSGSTGCGKIWRGSACHSREDTRIAPLTQKVRREWEQIGHECVRTLLSVFYSLELRTSNFHFIGHWVLISSTAYLPVTDLATATGKELKEATDV
jgi:hypothetical protein